jgi:predicted phage gp36 major capsid-like protein
MRLRVRVERLQRCQQQHQAADDRGAEIRRRLAAAEARLRKVAADEGRLAEYEKECEERREFTARLHRDPAVAAARGSGDIVATLQVGRQRGRALAPLTTTGVATCA